MRLFLAINPPAEVRRAAWEATAPLREVGPDLSWVAESKIHLTLKFLGVQPDSAIEPLNETLAGLGRNHASSPLRIGGVGAFPNFRRARVVWIGVEPDPRLELLHHDVEVACEKLGYELDGRPFRPHLTIGRIRETPDPQLLLALRAAAKKVRFTDEFLVQSIDLMRSVTESGGSRYETLLAAPTHGG
jgi:RNA 2',3'-cyclic 3'-phosphodiesterase